MMSRGSLDGDTTRGPCVVGRLSRSPIQPVGWVRSNRLSWKMRATPLQQGALPALAAVAASGRSNHGSTRPVRRPTAAVRPPRVWPRGCKRVHRLRASPQLRREPRRAGRTLRAPGIVRPRRSGAVHGHGSRAPRLRLRSRGARRSMPARGKLDRGGCSGDHGGAYAASASAAAASSASASGREGTATATTAPTAPVRPRQRLIPRAPRSWWPRERQHALREVTSAERPCSRPALPACRRSRRSPACTSRDTG